MAKKKKNSRENDGAALDMTPMIDVVFQLIIFFVVTMRQEDILSHLDAIAPAGSASSAEEQLDLLTIDICNPKTNSGVSFLFNNRPVTKEQLDTEIGRAARNSTTATVMLRCTTGSPHKFLVQALDLCNKHKMTNLAIFTVDAK